MWRRPPKETDRATVRDPRLRPTTYDPDRLRAGLRAVRIERMFRVVHSDHRGTPLAAVPAPSRFSDPRTRYAVLYAAETVRCAFWETLGRNRFARRKHRELPRVGRRRFLTARNSAESISWHAYRRRNNAPNNSPAGWRGAPAGASGQGLRSWVVFVVPTLPNL